ncbi:MAG TPA: hypothetical protein VKZ49_08590 [Polyangiaceae bacterium]|nr:hypothetical protein [Polyangiaceae bacterium]
MQKVWRWFGVAVTGWVGVACVVQEGEGDTAELRQVVPPAEAVLLAGPESSAAPEGEASAQRTLYAAGEPWAQGPWAKYYGLTRHVRDQINAVTRHVLGGVWFIVHTPPTDVSAGRAVWGPYTDALEPVTYRLVVLKIGRAEYTYTLEGRPRGSTSEADYRVVLQGSGYGPSHPDRGKGFFEVDLDTARALDPLKNTGSGTLRIEHDLPANAWGARPALPRTVTATATPSDIDAYWTVTSSQTEAGGQLDMNARDDLDASKMTELEDIRIFSRWNESGAGRADIVLSEGDIPEAIGQVTAVECWGSDFLRSYYGDSVDFEPAEGDPSACAFEAASF